jgi:hypothetical protein
MLSEFAICICCPSRALENVIPYMLMKMTMQMRDLDLNTRKRLAKETMKQFPHVKPILKDGQIRQRTILKHTLNQPRRSAPPMAQNR